MRDLFCVLDVSTMSTDKVSVHGSWASRWVFILAATGSAVGLGSIWKFPYMVGVYGGGAFVLGLLLESLLRSGPDSGDDCRDAHRSPRTAEPGQRAAFAGTRRRAFVEVVLGRVCRHGHRVVDPLFL